MSRSRKKAKRIKTRLPPTEYAAQGSANRPVQSYQNYIAPPSESRSMQSYQNFVAPPSPSAVMAQNYVVENLIPTKRVTINTPSSPQSVTPLRTISGQRSAAVPVFFSPDDFEDLESTQSEISNLSSRSRAFSFSSMRSHDFNIEGEDDTRSISSLGSSLPSLEIANRFVPIQVDEEEEEYAQSPEIYMGRPVSPESARQSVGQQITKPYSTRVSPISSDGTVLNDMDTSENSDEKMEYLKEEIERVQEYLADSLSDVRQWRQRLKVEHRSEKRQRLETKLEDARRDYDDLIIRLQSMQAELFRKYPSANMPLADSLRALYNEIQDEESENPPPAPPREMTSEEYRAAFQAGLVEIFGLANASEISVLGSNRYGIARYNDRGPDGSTRTDNECFAITYDERTKTIEVGHLRYPFSPNCRKTGTELLRGLSSFAQNHGWDLVIGQDASSYPISPGVRVNMAQFKILTTGQSFYNANNFVSASHPDQVRANKITRQKKLRDVLDYDRLSDRQYPQVIRLINGNPDMTVAEFGKLVKKLTDRGAPPLGRVDTEMIQQALLRFEEKRVFDYDPFNLVYVPNSSTLYDTYN